MRNGSTARGTRAPGACPHASTSEIPGSSERPTARESTGGDMARLKIGVVFGGSSEEHPISVKSARQVAKNLDPEKYEPYWIGITEDGQWRLCDGPEPGWEDGPRAFLSPDTSVHGLLV